MELNDVIKFLKDNAGDKAVQEYLASLKALDVNSVKAFINTEDGKKIVQPLIDAQVQKGIETYKTNFKTNELDSLVEKKYNELHPAETETEKQLRELKQKFEASQKAANLSNLKSAALKTLVSKGIDAEKASKLVDVITFSDADTLNSNVAVVTEVLESEVTAGVKRKFKDIGRDNIDVNVNEVLAKYNKPNPFKKDTFNLTEQGRLYKEGRAKNDMSLYNALKSAAGK